MSGARSLALGAAVLAALAAGPALAHSELDQRILDLREQGRIDPDQALAQLLALQPRMDDAPPLTRTERLVQIGLAQRLMRQNDAALATAEQIIAYGQSLHDDVVIAHGMRVKAIAVGARGDAKAAHQLALDAEKLAYTTNDKALQAQAATTAGEISARQGNFLTALDHLQAAVRLARQAGEDPVLLVNALLQLTYLHVQTSERDKAFGSLDELEKETARLRSTALSIEAKFMEYEVANRFGQPKRALQALLDNLDLERKLGARRLLVSTQVNLSNLYLKSHDYASAAHHASEALRQAVANKSPLGESKARMNLGHAYLGLGRVAEGKKYYETGMAWLDKNDLKPHLQEALMEYGQALEAAGDMAGPVQAYHRERALSDEMSEAQRRKSMLELQQKYETEKKQRQIELLSRENQVKGAEIDNRRLQQRVWWLLAAAFALASMVVGLLYRKVRHANARLEVKNMELKAQSTLDPLTALYNRRHFQDFMRTMNLADRQSGQHGDDIVGALFLLDVDHFKHINDTYGHAAGDVVLKMIAENLRVALRETDMIVRWGGEEFLAFLPAIPRHGIDEIARRILVGISSQTIRYQEHDISVNVSVGFAPYPLVPADAPLPWERAVNLVDMALYLAKAHGRNRAYGVRGFNKFQHTSMEAIEQDLERAWRDGFVDLSVVLGDAPQPQPPSEHGNVRALKPAAKAAP
ncbi:tetratricopeptide repeat-containing diguanylate cyclase [Duganella sp. LjRoot269]|uniref:tetratricopeptide repeat-containing diguanylate cyclase n=1 Tax=Duganella sp. LjRoot269 TaxID=3342305 RepID=UPI003ECC321E